MTEAEFVNNNRGIDQDSDLPRDQLEGMYRRIKEAEIRMDEGDMFESEVITFVAPKKCGWLKKKGTGASHDDMYFVLHHSVFTWR